MNESLGNCSGERIRVASGHAEGGRGEWRMNLLESVPENEFAFHIHYCSAAM
jgi:hypothetical protein